MFANLPINALLDGFVSWDDERVRKHIQELLDVAWYEDGEGFLYIVTDTDVYRLDNEIADRMGSLLRLGAGPDTLDKYCNVSRVDDCLHRFSKEDGFYHA